MSSGKPDRSRAKGERPELLSYLLGELDEERTAALERELARDPRARAKLEQLRATWEGLSLPEGEPPPPDLTARIVERAAAGFWPGGSARWFPTALATASLALGVWLGALANARLETPSAWEDVLAPEPGLLDAYWESMGSLATDDEELVP